MRTTIQCFLPYVDEQQVKATVEGLKESSLVSKITLLATDPEAKTCLGCDLLHIDSLNSSATMLAIAEHCDSDYLVSHPEKLFTRDEILALLTHTAECPARISALSRRSGGY